MPTSPSALGRAAGLGLGLGGAAAGLGLGEWSGHVAPYSPPPHGRDTVASVLLSPRRAPGEYM